MKKIILSVLTLTMLGTVALPVKADEANVQSSSQVSTQEGRFNTSIQRSSQEIRTNTRTLGVSGRNRRGTSSGNVQDILQDSLQRGVDNLNNQSSRQKIETKVDNDQRAPRRRGRSKRDSDNGRYGRRDRY